MDHLTLPLLFMFLGPGHSALAGDETGAPSISLKQSCGLLLEGEPMEITCSAPTHAPGSTFHLYRDGRHLASETPSANASSATFVSAAIRAENYTCRYLKKVNGRNITSPDSNPLRISVHEPLLQPTMSLNEKSGLFVKGESVQITCSGPSRYLGSTFKLYRNGWCNSTETAVANSSGVTFTAPGLGAGDYKCIYLKTLEGRTLSSPDSDSLRISILDPLEKPAITPKRNSGLFLTGERAEVTCTGSVDYPGCSFDLLREGSDVAMQVAVETVHTVTFGISGVTAGRYTCRYRKTLNGRTLTSPESDNLRIFVMSPLPKPIVSVKGNSSVFLRGEDVRLRCSASEDYQGYTLFIYGDGRYVTSKTVRGHGYTFTFSTWRISSGNYQCRCVKTLHRRRLSSQHSDPVRISLHDAPQRPSLSLHYKLLVKGEPTTMTCYVSTSCSNCTVNLYRNGTEINSATTTYQSHGFTLLASENSTGTYTCSYRSTVEGRTLTSPPSESVWVSVLDPLSKPRIFLVANSSVFARGEPLEISCQSSCLDCSYQMFAGDQMIESPPRGVYNFLVDAIEGCNYSCRYEQNLGERWLTSPNSDTIPIFVADALDDPRIALNRKSGVYANGETALLACMGSSSYLDSLFTFFKDNVPLSTSNATMDRMFAVTLMLPNLSDSDRGSYHCTYQKDILGRLLQSEASDPVQLTVFDLPKPALSVQSESVVKGGTIRFNCTGPGPVPGATFYLRRAGDANYTAAQTAPGTARSVTFSIPCCQESDSGSYTCLYQVRIAETTMASTRSDSVHVAVTAGFSWFVFTGSLSIVGLLLLVLLAVVLWKKMAKGSLASENRPLNSPGVEDTEKTTDSAVALKPVSRDEKEQSCQYESLEF